MNTTNKPALKLAEPGIPLPEHRQKQVEAGLATYQSVLAERDMLERQLRDAITKIESLNQQLSSMQGIVNMMESAYITSKADLEGRVAQYQKQRDHAVARVATLEAHLMNAFMLIESAIKPSSE
jgi:chaperonin cofactor prefoldin